MPSAQEMFENAKEALGQHDQLKARDLLAQLIKQNKQNAEYWVWMSAAAESKKERIYCLKEVLKLDPENRTARFGLQIAGEREFDPSLIIPLERQVHNWEKRFMRAPAPKVISRKLIGQIALFVAIIGVLIFAGWFLLINTVGIRQNNRGIQSIVGATATASLTPSPGAGTPQGTFTGLQPLWMQLKATYTPTPLYVNTPHPLLEAYTAGIRAYVRNDWPNVINYFQQVVSTDPNALDGYYLIGEAYRFMGDNAKALQQYNLALTRNNGFAPAYLGRAWIHLSESPEQWQEARDDLLHTTEMDPNFGEAFIELATIEIDHGTTVKAQEYLNAAASLLPGSPLVTYSQARIDLLNGYKSKAYLEAQQANQQDITYLPTYRLLGEILQSQGMILESFQPLQTYLLYANQDLGAWVMIGKAYAAMGDLDNALQAYNTAIQNGLQSYDLWMARGDLYILKDDGEAAYNDYARALSSNRDSFDASLGIGKAYLLMKEYGNSFTQISRADGLVNTTEQKAAIFYWRAQALEGLLYENQVKDFVVFKEWQSLLALPASSIPAAWRETATQHLALLQTPTPTLTSTLTPAPTLNPTLAKTQSTPTVNATP